MLKLLKQTRLIPFKLPRIFLPGSLLGTNQNTVLFSTQSEDEALLNPPGLSLHGVFRVLSSLTCCSAGGWARKAERTQHGPPASQEKELGAAGRISLRHSQPARPPQHRRAPRGRDRPGRDEQGGTAGTAARQGRGPHSTGGTARASTGGMARGLTGVGPAASTGVGPGASTGVGPGASQGARPSPAARPARSRGALLLKRCPERRSPLLGGLLLRPILPPLLLSSEAEAMGQSRARDPSSPHGAGAPSFPSLHPLPAGAPAAAAAAAAAE